MDLYVVSFILCFVFAPLIGCTQNDKDHYQKHIENEREKSQHLMKRALDADQADKSLRTLHGQLNDVQVGVCVWGEGRGGEGELDRWVGNDNKLNNDNNDEHSLFWHNIRVNNLEERNNKMNMCQ